MSNKSLLGYAPVMYEELNKSLKDVPKINASQCTPEHTEGLKPCPFCGSHNVDVRQEFSSCQGEAVCDDCGVTLYRDTMQEAIKAWNRRHRNDT